MRKEVFISDLSGKECKDHVQITISRNGHGVRIGNNTIFGDVVLDVDASELNEVLSTATFVKSKGIMPSELQVSPEEVSGMFLGNPKERKEV